MSDPDPHPPAGWWRRRSWTLTAVLALGMVLLAGFPDGGRTGLRLEAGTWSQQPWRLWTGHLVHFSLNHAALNAATWLLFSALFPVLRTPAVLLASLFVVALGVDLGVLAGHRPAWYVGFSGIVYGLAAVGVVLEWGRRGSMSWLVLVGLGIKLVSDAGFGTPASTERMIGGSVLSEAHVYGVVTGLGWGSVLRGLRRPGLGSVSGSGDG
jgi:rhomboid family GlyGly-CTERM serine protease